MQKIDADSIVIAEDQILNYCPMRVLIYDTDELNKIADTRQREHGEVTYFDYTNPDNDYDGWYNFYLSTDGEKVTGMFYENEGGDYLDSIEIDEATCQILTSKIIDYYGGEEVYKNLCDEWYYDEERRQAW